MGRQFACHVYNEDDLTPASVSQSIFDIPIEAHEIGDAHDVDAPGKYNDKDESKSDGTSTGRNPWILLAEYSQPSQTLQPGGYSVQGVPERESMYDEPR